ncbi:MAG: hypothetical protein SFX19_03830 [Alphaproteobacteria bacterium]|nr:hypothetical protein [Alphaproteobacteria bacterium]
MGKLTTSEQIIAEKTVCILLIRGESPDGGKMYAYVAVRADKLEGFMEAQKSGTFFPEDYGMILEAGEGEPSDEVKTKMTQEYGFNHDSMMDIEGSKGAHDIASNISGIVQAASKNKKDGDAE